MRRLSLASFYAIAKESQASHKNDFAFFTPVCPFKERPWAISWWCCGEGEFRN